MDIRPYPKMDVLVIIIIIIIQSLNPVLNLNKVQLGLMFCSVKNLLRSGENLCCLHCLGTFLFFSEVELCVDVVCVVRLAVAHAGYRSHCQLQFSA